MRGHAAGRQVRQSAAKVENNRFDSAHDAGFLQKNVWNCEKITLMSKAIHAPDCPADDSSRRCTER